MREKSPILGIINMVLLFLSMSFVSFYAFAQDVIAPGDFLAQVVQAVQAMGGLKTIGKIAAVILLIVASMKVTFLNDLLWSKLGAAKVWLAPALGLIAGVLGIGNGDAGITFASVFAYVTAGAGAVFLHEILDSVKAIPGIGSIYVTIINLIQGALGGPDESAALKR